MNVYQAINAVQSDLAKEGISKSRRNTQQGYQFRGIDDVFNALSPLLSKHGLVILPRVVSRECVERQTKSGGALFYTTVEVEFDFIAAEDGSKHTVITFGEAMDSADKSTNKAMSAAYKYAAMQAFSIPTEGDNDADASTPDVASKTTDAHPPAPGNPFDADPAAFKDERDEILSLVSVSNSVEDLTELWHTPRVRKFIKEAPADISNVVKTAFTSRKAGLLAKAA